MNTESPHQKLPLTLATACAVMMAATCVPAVADISQSLPVVDCDSARQDLAKIGSANNSLAAADVATNDSTRDGCRRDGHANDLEQSEVIRRITAYCAASWQNSRIAISQREDCTQEVFARVLSTLPGEKLAIAITQQDSQERRELNRAIWAVAQRQRRQLPVRELIEHETCQATVNDPWPMLMQEMNQVQTALDNPDLRLSATQKTIIQSVSQGISIPEIATRLNLTPARVSDEKYKATQKLRRHFAIDA